MSDTPLLETRGVSVRFGGHVAVKDVSLTVQPGTVTGLIGPNGAGKTTLIKILLGMLAPTSGSAHLLGQPVGSVEARRDVGYLPEDHRLPEYHTGPSLLDVYGGLQGLNKADMAKQYGDEQVLVWRRSYDTPPPALEANDPRGQRQDLRYAKLPADAVPLDADDHDVDDDVVAVDSRITVKVADAILALVRDPVAVRISRPRHAE